MRDGLVEVPENALVEERIALGLTAPQLGIVAGAVLFGGYALVNRGEPDTVAAAPIHIGDGEVRWLRETFANQWRREPTSEELNGLLASLLEEELLAREARALGLDQNDTIVRRRLAQNDSFFGEITRRGRVLYDAARG